MISLASTSGGAESCDDYHKKILEFDRKINEHTNKDVVAGFCKTQSPENKALLTQNNICPDGKVKYEELKKLYNESLTRNLVLNGLKELKAKFEEDERNLATTSKEQVQKAQELKTNLEKYKNSLEKAALVQSSFEKDLHYVFDSQNLATPASPYYAFMKYMATNKEIVNNFDSFDRFVGGKYLCGLQNNKENSFCKNYKESSQENKAVLYDLFKTRYQFNSDKPNEDDLDFAKNYLDDKNVISSFKNVLNIKVAGQDNLVSIEKYKELSQVNELESSIENYLKDDKNSEKKTAMLKQLEVLNQKSSYIENASFNRVEIQKSAKEALFDQYKLKDKQKIKEDRTKLNKDDFYQSLTQGEDKVQETLYKAKQEDMNSLVNDYQLLKSFKPEEFSDSEVKLRDNLLTQLIDKYEQHMNAAYHELHPEKMKDIQSTTKAKIDEAKKLLLEEKRSCLKNIGFDPSDSQKTFGKSKNSLHDIGHCLLGEHFLDDDDYNKALSEAATKYNLYKSLLSEMELDKNNGKYVDLSLKKKDYLIRYVVECEQRFDDTKINMPNICDQGGRELVASRELIELVEDSSQAVTYITSDILKALDEKGRMTKEQELAAAEKKKQEELQKANNNNDETVLDDIDETGGDNEEVSIKKEKNKRSSRNDTRVGENGSYGQKTFLDQFSIGIMNAAKDVAPHVARYQQIQQQSTWAMQQAQQYSYLSMQARLGLGPTYNPNFTNGLYNNFMINSQSYFRSPLTPSYSYDSGYNQLLYQSGFPGQSPIARSGSGAVNIPVNFPVNFRN